MKKKMKNNNKVRNLLIFLFTVILIIGSYYLGKTKGSEVINNSQLEIKTLNKLNKDLLVKNDSLDTENHKYDSVIVDLNENIEKTTVNITKVNNKIIKLNETKNETNNYIDSVSAYGIADLLSRFIEERTKSQSSN